MSELQTRIQGGMWTLAVICAVLAAGGLIGLDRAAAQWIATLPGDGPRALHDGLELLDLATLKNNSTFLLGTILLMVAAALLVLRSTRPMGWTMLYIGAVQFVSTVIADLAKPQFGRFRPAEALADPGAADLWFVGGNSFPSGHTAFYAGLFFPLMLVFPRWWPLFTIVPFFVAAERIVSNDHYLSDVSASLALAALLTVALTAILRRAG